MQKMEQLHAYDDCYQNQATEYHNKCTHVYMNCESGLAIIYKACCMQAVCQKRLSSDFNAGTMSQATKTNGINKLPCSFLVTLATDLVSS